MVKRVCGFLIVAMFLLSTCGCAVIATALSAAAAWGISQAIRK